MSDLGENPTLRDAITISRDLLESLVDEDDCWFDHHGGCQAHMYLSLKPGEVCPQQQIKDLLARELVVPSPQPAASASSTYKMVDPYKSREGDDVCTCGHGRNFHAYPGPASTPCSVCPCKTFVDAITGSTQWAVSPLTDAPKEQT